MKCLVSTRRRLAEQRCNGVSCLCMLCVAHPGELDISAATSAAGAHAADCACFVSTVLAPSGANAVPRADLSPRQLPFQPGQHIVRKQGDGSTYAARRYKRGAFQLRCGLSDLYLEAFPKDHLRDIFAAVQPASHRHHTTVSPLAQGPLLAQARAGSQASMERVRSCTI